MAIQRTKPVVDQVSGLLRDRIRNGNYVPDVRLPSESELAAELGVSRATVRGALAQLATEGLVLRRQGDGTYINEHISEVDRQFGHIWDFWRLIEANGYAPSIENVSAVTRSATEAEAAALAIASNAPVVALRRVFLADERPVIATTNVLDATRLQAPLDSSDGALAIHDFVAQYCAEQILYAVTDVEVSAPSAALDTLLNRPIAYPVLKLIETFYNKSNVPIVYGLSHYDHTILRLRLVKVLS